MVSVIAKFYMLNWNYYLNKIHLKNKIFKNVIFEPMIP